MSGKRRRTGPGVSLPRWFSGAHSGIISVSANFPLVLPREVFERRLRGGGGSGKEPRVLVLNQESPEAVRDSNGPVWTTTPAHVIDLLRRGDLDLTALRTIMTRVPSEDALAFLADVGYILSKSEGSPQIVLLVEDDLPLEAFERIPTRRWRRSDLRPQRMGQQKGSDTMADKKDSHIQDPQTLREEVREIIRRIHD
ncbi:MAG: hypothetical protein PF508_17485, partial [Spirochaeta sp.]|nr:hypothetical protein [Spirochaeta sp.]